MADLNYDPTEYSSAEEYAKSRAEMDREFGMPKRPYTGAVGRRVNQQHYERERDMNNEFGWGGTTDADLRRKWGL